MDLKTMLLSKHINPAEVLVFRHRPTPPALRKRLPWLAAEHPAIYNAYQCFQNERVEKAMSKRKYIASFIAYQSKSAIFVGLYERTGWVALAPKEYIEHPARKELVSRGMEDKLETDVRNPTLFFDLEFIPQFFGDWKGKLIVDWPPPPIAWFRKADESNFVITAILEESAFERGMPDWDKLYLSWIDLSTIPQSWRIRLQDWRGIYLIFDRSDGRGYVGSAYGTDNLLGRWLNYGKTGHGGNKLLLARDPTNFQFSILERVSPDLPESEVIAREASWKDRLHTRTHGLNEN